MRLFVQKFLMFNLGFSVILLLLSFEGFLYVLDISHRSCVLHIFFPTLGLTFFPLAVPFTEQVCNFCKAQFIFFYSCMSHAFE